MSSISAYCKVAIAPVREDAKDSSEMVTQLLFGEMVDVMEEQEKWWKIRTYQDNYIGWVDPKQLRKLSKKEAGRWLDGLSYQRNLITELITPWGKQLIVKGSFVPFHVKDSFSIGNDEYFLAGEPDEKVGGNPVAIALEYLNAPYLWGGKTPFGIDCSGLTQQVFRFLEINLPRDASQQVEYGTSIDFEERLPGDVLFFSNENGKVIHVGIIKDDNEIIHASGQVRIDRYYQKGILHYSGEYYTHSFSAIKRMI